MSKIEIVKKHWPHNVATPTPLMLMLATEFEMAETDEIDIEKICNLIGDFGDEKFAEGVNAVKL